MLNYIKAADRRVGTALNIAAKKVDITSTAKRKEFLAQRSARKAAEEAVARSQQKLEVQQIGQSGTKIDKMQRAEQKAFEELTAAREEAQNKYATARETKSITEVELRGTRENLIAANNLI